MSEQQEELSMEEAQKIWEEEANKNSESAEEILEASPDDDKEVIEEPEVAEEEDQPQEVEASEQSEEVEEQPADPFDGLPEAVKQKLAKIDELEKSNQTLLHHVKTAEGRVAAMQREHDIARRVKEEVAKQNNETPTQKQITTAGKDPEKWTQLREDFPEWAAGIEEYLSSKMQSNQNPANAITPQQIEGYVNNQITGARNEMARKIEEATLDGRHPQWREDVKTTDFNNWLSSQPNEIRLLAESQQSKDAIRMMDLFYESKKTPATEIKQNRVQKLAKAANPNRRGQTPPPKSVDDMTAEELWNYEARKRAKTREIRGY